MKKSRFTEGQVAYAGVKRQSPLRRRKHCRINAPRSRKQAAFLHRRAQIRGYFCTRAVR